MKLHSPAEIFNKHALEYQSRFMNVDLYSDTLDRFCKELPLHSKVLDIACGPGNITRYLLGKRPDLNILGIDLAPEMIELAKANNPTARFSVMDCRNLLQIGETFDGIVCGFCLPYLDENETEQLLTTCKQLLKSGGVLYLSTMEDDYSKSGPVVNSHGESLLMYFYKSKDLQNILFQNSYRTILETSKQTDSVTDLILISKLD